METKTDQVRRLVASHKWKDALKIVKDFRLGLTADQRLVLGRAWASYGHGYMMMQMKRDPEACREAGIALLKQIWGDRHQGDLQLIAGE